MNFGSYLIPVRKSLLMFITGMFIIGFAPVRADQAGDGQFINLELKEWYIRADVDHIKAGPVTFRATNHGKEEHELVIVKTDMSIDRLPMREGKVDEDGIGDVIGEIEEFSPRKTQEAMFNLEPGRYVLFCNIAEQEHSKIESHYMEGMRIALTVE